LHRRDAPTGEGNVPFVPPPVWKPPGSAQAWPARVCSSRDVHLHEGQPLAEMGSRQAGPDLTSQRKGRGEPAPVFNPASLDEAGFSFGESNSRYSSFSPNTKTSLNPRSYWSSSSAIRSPMAS